MKSYSERNKQLNAKEDGQHWNIQQPMFVGHRDSKDFNGAIENHRQMGKRLLSGN